MFDEKQILDSLRIQSNKSSSNIIRDSISLFGAKEMGIERLILTIIISVSLAFILAIQENSYEIITKIADCVLDIEIAVYGVIFTGYSIFQALLSPKMVYLMLKQEDAKNHNKSVFITSTDYYISYIVLVIINIMICFGIKIFECIVPLEWNLFENVMINNILFGILAFIYVFLIIVTLSESICFVANIYRIYSVAATEKYINELKDKDSTS